MSEQQRTKEALVECRVAEDHTALCQVPAFCGWGKSLAPPPATFHAVLFAFLVLLVLLSGRGYFNWVTRAIILTIFGECLTGLPELLINQVQTLLWYQSWVNLFSRPPSGDLVPFLETRCGTISYS